MVLSLRKSVKTPPFVLPCPQKTYLTYKSVPLNNRDTVQTDYRTKENFVDLRGSLNWSPTHNYMDYSNCQNEYKKYMKHKEDTKTKHDKEDQ